jgi:hypothetical protein
MGTEVTKANEVYLLNICGSTKSKFFFICVPSVASSMKIV